jgi:hypothetical protein
MSPTFSLTRPQPLSLLSIARLKRTRFRLSPSSSIRVRIDQTSFIFRAGFRPGSLPALNQRCPAGPEFSAGPFDWSSRMLLLFKPLHSADGKRRGMQTNGDNQRRLPVGKS